MIYATSALLERGARCEASCGRQNVIGQATRLNIQSDIAVQRELPEGPGLVPNL
jgi:hypothetical protein